VAEPLALAAYLLAGQDGWTREKIAAAMQGDANEVVDLERPVAVHIAYPTAWVDPSGRMQFRDDVYGRDPALREALAAAAPAARS
jgi:murein L,D-transpeptidase YcbB/YkuD